MKEFFTVAKDDIGVVDESKQVRMMHDGNEIVFNEPSSGQLAIMMAMGGRKMSTQSAGNFIALFLELADPETQRYLENRLLDRDDNFGMEEPGGIFDLWEALTEEWSARPTKQPQDYQPPRRATGHSSTAPSRVRA